MQTLDVMLKPFESFLVQFSAFLPTLLGALLVLIIGWLVARAVKAGVTRLLGLVRFRQLAERSGIEAFLDQGQLHVSLASLIAALAYWLVILVTVSMAANSLGLTVVAELFNRAALYLPNVIAAVFLLIFGILAARLVNRTLFAFLNSIRFDGALVLATLAEYAVTVFAVFMALEQLQISTALLHSAFQIGFGGLVLALALAFGLGGREWAAEILKRLSKDKDGSSQP
jgi:hypothetical protein